VALSMEHFGFPVEVAAMLEVGHVLVEVPAFEAVSDAGEFFVFSVELGDDGMAVRLKLSSAFMVALVALDLGEGSEVH